MRTAERPAPRDVLDEELPTGRFGGPYSAPPRVPERLPRTTPEDAAAHRATLIQAVYRRRRAGEAA